MSKVAHYLQEHITGEVTAGEDARRYFATDASILTMAPALVVYPRNENDVRKTARFTWQLAERGRVVPITARGLGSNTVGAALGNGIILDFPAHMNRILELDGKSGAVVVEPGLNYGRLQQTLFTHDRFLPPFPAAMDYSTIGGAVADNTAGEKSLKYGDTRDYVKSLRVVLANGEIIDTGRLSKRDLSKKLGLATFEGEIYRAIDTLIEDSHSLIEKTVTSVTKNTAGYYLADVKRKDGSFDLTPLIVGSQGTLGVITEITLETEPYAPNTALIVVSCDDIAKAQTAITALRAMSDMPSAIEMVDGELLALVDKLNPNLIKDVAAKPFPRLVLLVEYDNAGDRGFRRLLKKARKMLDKTGLTYQVLSDVVDQDKYWKLRDAAATVVGYSENGIRALPIMHDGIVPPNKFKDYLEGIYAIFERARLHAAVWGHAGDAHLTAQPFLDLGEVGDRQKAIRMLDEYYNLVLSLGGSIAGECGEGRLGAPFLKQQYGEEVYAMFQKVKQIFDPYGTLNPGVKVNGSLDSVKSLMRSHYSLGHLYSYLPRS